MIISTSRLFFASFVGLWIEYRDFSVARPAIYDWWEYLVNDWREYLVNDFIIMKAVREM